MTTLKRILILYFSSLLVFIIFSTLFGNNVFSILKSTGFWILPIFLILVGQIIGYVLSLGLEETHLKKRIFNISYLVTLVGFIGLTFYFKYSNWRHKKDFGNIEANQQQFKYYLGPNVREDKIAFDSLSKLFVDPNSFELIGGQARTKDTVINGNSYSTLLTILHYKKEKQKGIFKAEFAVFNNTARMIYFDKPLDDADKVRIDSLEKKVLKDFNDGMKILPDSIKKEMEKDFSNLIYK